MRSTRLMLLFLAFYLIFIGGSAYYALIFPVRLLHHAVITVLMAVWFFRKWRGDGLPRTPLDVGILALLVVVGLSAATSIDPRMAVENLWFLLLHLFIFYVLIDLFQQDRHKQVMEVTFIMGALIVLISALELASWYFGLGIVPGTSVGWFQVHPVPLEVPSVRLAMGNSNLIAGPVAPLIPVTLAWGITVQRRDYRVVLLGLAAALTVVLLLTESYGGYLSLLTAGILWIILRLWQRNKRLALFLLGSLLLGGFVLAALLLTYGNAIDPARTALYQGALGMVVDHPLTGVGPGLYGADLRHYLTTIALHHLEVTHNIVLNIAAELGFLGILVVAGVLALLVYALWKRWHKQQTPTQNFRYEAVISALAGYGMHLMVDGLLITRVLTFILVILAYSIVGHSISSDKAYQRPRGLRWPAAVGLGITLAYAIFFIGIDRAHIAYQRSMDAGGDASLSYARQAERLDPHLNLYDLHIAYLIGRDALKTNDPVTLEDAVRHYEDALQLEPTWTDGYINLVAVEVARGNHTAAMEHALQAADIRPLTAATFHAARIAERENLASQEQITEWYAESLKHNESPTSTFWDETPARRTARERFIREEVEELDVRYRILRVYDPGRAVALVPDEPQTAGEYWVKGEHALEASGNPAEAEAAFTEAIKLDRNNGDYYAARARSRVESDPQGAEHDLDMARLLGTSYESINAVQAQLTDNIAKQRELLANAISPRTLRPFFASVVFGGRRSVFDVPDSMRLPGPGHEQMQPWYRLAASYTETGDMDAARRVYEAILDYAPYEEEARAQLQTLRAD